MNYEAVAHLPATLTSIFDEEEHIRDHGGYLSGRTCIVMYKIV